MTIKKEHLPDAVLFDVYGSSGPQEKAQETQNQIAALQLVVQLEAAKKQMAQAPGPDGDDLDFTRAQREILGKAFSDPDIFFKQEPNQSGPAVAFDPGLQGAFEESPSPEDALLMAQYG